jgi:hypothetical protein
METRRILECAKCGYDITEDVMDSVEVRPHARYWQVFECSCGHRMRLSVDMDVELDPLSDADAKVWDEGISALSTPIAKQ